MVFYTTPVKNVKPNDKLNIGGILYIVKLVEIVNRWTYRLRLYADGGDPNREVRVVVDSETLWMVAHPGIDMEHSLADRIFK